MATRILIADDHEVVRKGLRALLETKSEWEVCGEARDGREAVDKTKALKPDIAILDISMPRLGGLEATRRIVKAAPRTEVLILTMHESEEMVDEVLKAGARGFVLKSDAGRELMIAVENLRQHKPFFTTKITEIVLGNYLKSKNGGEIGSSLSCLTPREREVLQLLAEGKTNKEVSAILSVGTKTVETHRANIMNKLKLHSVSDLVHYAIRNHIVIA
jgi:DNA-binding NarL/FixJ family response regulator